jgi:hypothetical protein
MHTSTSNAAEARPTTSPSNTRPSAANLTRSKLVFRAYLDARTTGEQDEADELFALWLRLLGRAEP